MICDFIPIMKYQHAIIQKIEVKNYQFSSSTSLLAIKHQRFCFCSFCSKFRSYDTPHMVLQSPLQYLHSTYQSQIWSISLDLLQLEQYFLLEFLLLNWNHFSLLWVFLEKTKPQRLESLFWALSSSMILKNSSFSLKLEESEFYCLTKLFSLSSH